MHATTAARAQRLITGGRVAPVADSRDRRRVADLFVRAAAGVGVADVAVDDIFYDVGLRSGDGVMGAVHARGAADPRLVAGAAHDRESRDHAVRGRERVRRWSLWRVGRGPRARTSGTAPPRVSVQRRGPSSVVRSCAAPASGMTSTGSRCSRSRHRRQRLRHRARPRTSIARLPAGVGAPRSSVGRLAVSSGGTRRGRSSRAWYSTPCRAWS